MSYIFGFRYCPVVDSGVAAGVQLMIDGRIAISAITEITKMVSLFLKYNLQLIP